MHSLRKVYCIHIKGSTDRKRHVDSLLDQLSFSIPFYQFEGVIGAKVVNPRPSKHHKGHLGAVLSHMSLWYQIATFNTGSYLILEDDFAPYSQDHSIDFESAMNDLLSELPKSVKMVHCCLDKSRKFKYKKSQFENRYKVIGCFNGRDIKKASLVYPWPTLTGAYVISPMAARWMFEYAWWNLKNAWWLPLKPKRYNIDIMMSRSYFASIFGAMGLILRTNVNTTETSEGVSDIKRVERLQTDKDIFVSRSFFKHTTDRISIWE